MIKDIAVIIGAGEVLMGLNYRGVLEGLDAHHQTAGHIHQNPSVRPGRGGKGDKAGTLKPSVFELKAVGVRDGCGDVHDQRDVVRGGSWVR